METNSTLWASVEVTAMRTKMPMAFVTMSTSVWENWMRVACATVLVTSMIVAVLTFLLAIAIAWATSSMRSGYAAGPVQQTKMPMASVTMSMIA